MNYVDSAFISPAVLSLCPGILGLERGVERAIGELRVAAYVEIEAFIIANLVAAMEEGVLDPVPVWTDVKTFDAKPFRGKIHGIIGGYPCQPFSHAGLRAGEDDTRHLWPFIREIIRTAKPAWCFFENVRGHITLGFETVYKELSELGYRVEAGIFSAEEVGATHKRERLFILAVANTKCLSRWRKPRPEQYEGSSRWQSIENSRSHVANSLHTRLEGLWQCDTAQRWQEQNGQPGSMCTLWPAGQGSYQHQWEEPRAVKPGLGCTVDGYNFRTDLLRAYGNAVVEQTAELAFTTLLQKHYETSNL